MAAKRVAGVVYFKIDGEQLECSGSLQVPLNSVVRESVMGQTKRIGFKETLRAGYIAGAFGFDADFPIEKVTTGTEMTITAELANGKTYVLSNATLVDESDVANDDGTVELRFEGDGEYQ